MLPVTSDIDALIDRALAEDLGGGDPTTDALIPPELSGKAVVMSRAEGVLAGVDVGSAVFRRVDDGLATKTLIHDGAALEPESMILEVEGPVGAILRAERTAINFLQRMSGIASETARYVREVEGHNARILDTRKTTPGWRRLEKYAVRAGGGTNHRQNLGDGVLIKDNHIEALRRDGMKLGAIVKRAQSGAPHSLKVEVEVEDLNDVAEALDAGAHIILLDNMGLKEMQEAVEMARGRATVEASGGIEIENVRAVAATGVDLISVGSLTHSAKALDISLEVV